ncbi:hypothetical protein [Brevibacillus sp. NRS-1366]|uniref:hypothetical protein n=1 Tax=Brevibacillus sp. NRS-1366 TaxID=3233899 RepID=UPI003D2398EF
MSHMEYKTVIRVALPELEGLDHNQALPFFKEKVGEPKHLDEWDGVVEWFTYDDKPNTYCPVESLEGKYKWGIDYVLMHSDGYDYNTLDISLSELERYIDLLVQKFSVKKEDCRLLSYSWYNGGDEPIRF